ncbi:hypothetical protein VN12_21600 [Pirellula sp. SH-Sr6A]|nr:hypothetical protein VN12_21600 [Pirellula sp. SH-Sr6A]
MEYGRYRFGSRPAICIRRSRTLDRVCLFETTRCLHDSLVIAERLFPSIQTDAIARQGIGELSVPALEKTRFTQDLNANARAR